MRGYRMTSKPIPVATLSLHQYMYFSYCTALTTRDNGPGINRNPPVTGSKSRSRPFTIWYWGFQLCW